MTKRRAHDSPRGAKPITKAPRHLQLFDHSDAGTALRGIVLGNPGVRLTKDLIAEIGACEGRGASPAVARIIDEMMRVGLSSQSAAPDEVVIVSQEDKHSFAIPVIDEANLRSSTYARDDVLFGKLVEMGGFDERSPRRYLVCSTRCWTLE
jgi:hypothetical protein